MKPLWSLSFRYLIGILLLAACIGFLVYARIAMRSVVIAAFIAYLANPAVILLTRRTKIKRRAAVNLVYFTAIALFFAIPLTLTPLFFEELKEIAKDILKLFVQFQNLIAQPIAILPGMNLDLSQLGMGLNNLQTLFAGQIPSDAFLLIESTSRGVIWLLIIIVLVYLFLSEWQSMRKWLIQLAPQPYQAEVEELYARIRGVWMAYLRGQLLLMLIVGVVFTIAWTIIGIPGALVLGVLAGMFTLVPDVGPFIAVMLALGVALLEGSNWIPLSNGMVALIALIAYLVLINVKNLWLRPFIMGRMVNMNEGLVFVAILIATMLSGILGALLVVPVLASGIIVINYLLRRVLGQTPFAETDQLPKPRFPLSRIKKINRN